MLGIWNLKTLGNTGEYMRVPRWIWPREKRVETDDAIRLGRVVHWVASTTAAFFLTIVAILFLRSGAEFLRESWGVGLVIYLVICPAIGGRLARYILADE